MKVRDACSLWARNCGTLGWKTGMREVCVCRGTVRVRRSSWKSGRHAVLGDGTRRGWLRETQGKGFNFIQVGFVGQVGKRGPGDSCQETGWGDWGQGREHE